MTKICPRCSELKNEEDFYKKVACCKNCRSLYIKERRKENPELYQKYNQKNWNKYKLKYNEAQRNRYKEDLEKRREKNRQWKLKNSEKIKAQRKKYYLKKKGDPHFEAMRRKAYLAHIKTDKFRNRVNKRRKYRRQTDPCFKIRFTIGNRIRNCLKGKKLNNSEEIVGCSWENYLLHIESQFQEGMTWENHGKYDINKKTWQIDHIQPIASFPDLTNPEQLKACFHYTNTQPLWAIDNLKKGDKIL